MAPFQFHSSRWPNSFPMNNSFLPGCMYMYARNARALANCCHSSPGILFTSDAFPCTTSSCEIGSTKFSVKAYSMLKVMLLWWNLR
ncbi:MAG: hypothetical protein BWY85_02217 [Firmicutes bacterium ADurb.Bin506]|nr:MAG: hypothetical protein BWY85_02217 [Firmicutes bacterium ADurb.Bin506]